MPAPPELPTARPSMLIDVCWPMPGPVIATPPFALLRKIALIGAHGLRFNLDYRLADPVRQLQAVGTAGLRPLPILDYGGEVSRTDQRATPSQYAAFCRRVVTEAPWLIEVELGNEPNGKMSAGEYAALAKAGASAIRTAAPHVRIIIAGELFDHTTGESRDGFHQTVASSIPPQLYDAVAIHPYRLGPPDQSPWGSRVDEHVAILAATGGTPYVSTEVGWALDQVPGATDEAREAEQGLRVKRELEIERFLGVDRVDVYAHVSLHGVGHGVFRPDWTPRPAAIGIAEVVAAIAEGTS